MLIPRPNSYHRIIFFAINTLLLAGEIIFFTYSVYTRQLHETPDYWLTSCIMLIEAAMLFSPLLMEKNKWLWCALPVHILFAIILIANAIYARFYHDLLSLSQIFSSASYNDFVWEATMSALSPQYLLYLVPTLAVALMLIFPQFRHSIPIERKTFGRMWIFLGSAWVVGFIIGADKFRRIEDAPLNLATELRYMVSRACTYNKVGQMYDWKNQGFILYTLKLAQRYSKTFHSHLSEAERLEIENYLTSLPTPHITDKFCVNKDKNLIIIVVESLNSDAIGKKIDGVSMTSTLDSLLMAENVISNLNVANRIGKGKSSDGQMMINTGMLPLLNGSAAIDFGHNSFHSLAENPVYSIRKEYIGESPGLWNHVVTNKSWGFDTLAHSLIDADHRKSEDEQIMMYALNDMKNLRKPFMQFITTSSMHYPFGDEAIPRIPSIECSSLSPLEKEYYHSLNNFDTLLGQFIAEMKLRGVYDESVIVVVSDHGEMVTPDQVRDSRIGDTAFFVINSDTTLHLNRRADQADIYPTLLEVLSRKDKWRGLGISMLRDDYNLRHKRHDSEISDLMIRTDYFRNK